MRDGSLVLAGFTSMHGGALLCVRRRRSWRAQRDQRCHCLPKSLAHSRFGYWRWSDWLQHRVGKPRLRLRHWRDAEVLDVTAAAASGKSDRAPTTMSDCIRTDRRTHTGCREQRKTPDQPATRNPVSWPTNYVPALMGMELTECTHTGQSPLTLSVPQNFREPPPTGPTPNRTHLLKLQYESHFSTLLSFDYL